MTGGVPRRIRHFFETFNFLLKAHGPNLQYGMRQGRHIKSCWSVMNRRIVQATDMVNPVGEGRKWLPATQEEDVPSLSERMDRTRIVLCKTHAKFLYAKIVQMLGAFWRPPPPHASPASNSQYYHRFEPFLNIRIGYRFNIYDIEFR
jgi:hypothetical protein